MRMLVFGRNGQLARALKDIGGADVIALGRDDADLMRDGAAREAIAAHEADAVINAAAYTAVDKAETEEDAARRLNSAAPAEMAAAARAAATRAKTAAAAADPLVGTGFEEARRRAGLDDGRVIRRAREERRGRVQDLDEHVEVAPSRPARVINGCPATRHDA